MEQENFLKFHGPLDRMRGGFHSSSDFGVAHPVQSLEEREKLHNEFTKRKFIRCNYGLHMAMRLASEDAARNSLGRLPGLRSNSIHAQTLAGLDTTISFPDYIGGKRLFVDCI